MGLATYPEGTLSGFLLVECGLMALCSTWLNGEEGVSSESLPLPTSPFPHRHFHTLTSDLTYSRDVPGELGNEPYCPGWNPGEWGRDVFSTLLMIPDPSSFLFPLMLFCYSFLNIF